MYTRTRKNKPRPLVQPKRGEGREVRHYLVEEEFSVLGLPVELARGDGPKIVTMGECAGNEAKDTSELLRILTAEKQRWKGGESIFDSQKLTR